MGFPLTNLLLESLPRDVNASLSQHLERIHLPLGTPLYQARETPRYVHFITSGISSVVTAMEDGGGVEVGLGGREGFPEKLHLLGPQRGDIQCMMQVAGTALRIEFQRLQDEFLKKPALLQAILRYVQHDSLVLSQLGACNRIHEVEERLARWLLMVHDRVGEPELRLTQEFLGDMLGARRSSVNLAANSLQRAGVIRYSRGKIWVENRSLLESVACECYPIISKLFHSLYQV